MQVQVPRMSGLRSGIAQAHTKIAPRRTASLSVGLVVLTALVAVEIIRHGAFFPQDAFVVAVVALILIVSWLPSRQDRNACYVTVLLVSLSAWWLCLAMARGNSGSFLPLGASMLGFLAAFLVVRSLDDLQRRNAATFLGTLGTLASATGLIGSALRWYPIAMPAQGLWRLATTLTYSNAAGLLIGMSLVVLIGLDETTLLTRLGISVSTAGLLATQSRGALAAVVIGGVLIPLATLRRASWPVLTGIAAGVVMVGTSSGTEGQPLALAAAIALVCIGMPRPRLKRLRVAARHTAALFASLGVALIGVGAYALRTPIRRRIELASTSDRLTEWRAAIHQWHTSPFIGVGPDHVLFLNSVPGAFAHFAHNEYLQIGADAGVVGVLLLAGSMWFVVRTIRKDTVLQSSAAGALLAFGLAAVLDFDWHLAVLGLIGGWVAGLASSSTAEPHVPSEVITN